MHKQAMQSLFPIGIVVKTPTGRQAIVVGYAPDERLSLRYLDEKFAHRAPLVLKPELCTRQSGAVLQ